MVCSPSRYLYSKILLTNLHSSQVYSLDIFHTVFKPDPINASEGLRYRRMILEKGGSQDEMEMLSEFLGRQPSTEAFYRELGLA